MLFVLILEHVTCSKWMVVKLQCRLWNGVLCILGQIDICRLFRTSLTLIRMAVWTVSDLFHKLAHRILLTVEQFAFCFVVWVFFSSLFPHHQVFSLPIFPAPVAILFCSWWTDKTAWTCILSELGRLFPKFVTVFFTCHTIWRVVTRSMSNNYICNLIDFACVTCWQMV